jgi:Transcriptional regulator
MRKVEIMYDNGNTVTKVKMTNRQIRAQDTKLKIYSAALAEIQKKGYANVAISDITDAAGVAKGSFYTHFDSKESILRYTYDQLDPIYLQAYNKVKDRDFLTSLCFFVRASYAELEKRGKEVLKALTANYFVNEFLGVYIDNNRQIYKCLDMIICTAKMNGLLSDEIPTKKYVNIIISALIGVENYWCMLDDDISLADFAENSVRLLAMGMIDESKAVAR